MIRFALVLSVALPGVAAAQTVPANVDVPVTLVQELSSKELKAGATFDVVVSRDVWVDGRVVIPRGTPGRGEVTWRTGKGAFGKSGKMEIEVRSISIAGVEVPLTGKFREEGQGNTGATIGTIAVAGLVGGAFVTGRSAVFEQGRELRAVTTRPVMLSRMPTPFAAPVMAAVAPVVPAPVVAEPVVVAAVAPVAVAPVAVPAPVAAPVTRVVAVPAALKLVAVPPAAAAPVVPPVTRVVAVPVAPTPVAVAPAVAVPVAVAPPVTRVVAMPVVTAAPAPYAYAYAAPAPYVAAAAADLRAEAEDARYRSLLAEQQGVRGRSGQGWTISD